MTITNAIFEKETEKAICINWLNMLCWVPKSLVTITEAGFEVADWFYKKELSVKAERKLSSMMYSRLASTGERGLPAQIASL